MIGNFIEGQKITTTLTIRFSGFVDALVKIICDNESFEILFKDLSENPFIRFKYSAQRWNFLEGSVCFSVSLVNLTVYQSDLSEGITWLMFLCSHAGGSSCQEYSMVLAFPYCSLKCECTLKEHPGSKCTQDSVAFIQLPSYLQFMSPCVILIMVYYLVIRINCYFFNISVFF